MISNRARLNIALAAGLLALFALIYVEQRGTGEEGARIAELDAAQVETLRIERRDGETLLFEREGETWHMREPLQFHAETGRIVEIVDGLSIRSHASYPADELALDELGLGDPPEARVVIDGEAWHIGGRNPLEGWRYILHRDTVYLANDVLYFRLVGEPTDYARRQLLPSGSTITRIVLPDHTLTEDGSGGWTLEPDDPDISADALQRLVDAWRTAQSNEISTITEPDPVETSEVVSIHLDDHEAPLEFMIRRDDDGLSLLREDLGLAYRIPPARAEPLTRLERSTGDAGD